MSFYGVEWNREQFCKLLHSFCLRIIQAGAALEHAFIFAFDIHLRHEQLIREADHDRLEQGPVLLISPAVYMMELRRITRIEVDVVAQFVGYSKALPFLRDILVHNDHALVFARLFGAVVLYDAA